MCAVPAAVDMARVDWLMAGLTIALVILSLGVHEAAHAWAAWKLGDSTGKDQGRMTLNPIPHIDPFMTILVPLILLISNMPVFGGAKPVPVNVHRLRNPLPDMAVVSFAGPLSNFLLAIFFYALAKFFIETGYYNGASELAAGRRLDLLPSVLDSVAQINVLLFVFNLFPIPPLDGSKVVAQFLPASVRDTYLRMSIIGIVILYASLSLSPWFRGLLWDTQDKVMSIVSSIVTLGGTW